MQRLALAAVLGCLAAAAPAGAAKTPMFGIRTPSGNIACLAVPGRVPTLRCEVDHSSYGSQLQDRCTRLATVDWHGFELGRTTAGRVTCSGGILYDPDTQRPAYRTLAYGRTWRRDGFTCSSARTGLTCLNGHAHGLFLARESWRTW